MIQVSDQLYQFYHQMTQNQGISTEKNVQEVRNTGEKYGKFFLKKIFFFRSLIEAILIEVDMTLLKLFVETEKKSKI